MSDAPLAATADAHARPERVEVAGLELHWTAGCRGHPRPPIGWASLVAASHDLAGEVLDASGLMALPGRAAAATGRATVRVLEPSAAGLTAALRSAEVAAAAEEEGGRDGRADPPGERGVVAVTAGLPWDAPPAAFDHVLLAPPAERGSARVRAELAAATRALRSGGTLWLLLEKDRGAKRYEKDAAKLLASFEVVDRRKGWRLSRGRAQGDPTAAASREPELTPDADGAGTGAERAPWTRFDTPRGEAWALPGAFAAGKLDPGTALLLEALEAAGVGAASAGAEVLDLGCGWGAITRWAVEAGARVTATDDDLAAVRSARRNAPEAEVLHADLDLGVDPERRFDRVLINPPFHLGAGVRMGLPAAFLATAARRSRRGGEIWLVANEALPYGAWLEAEGFAVAQERAERGFRVWRASRRRRR